jgi:hypothetical protein
MNGTTIEKWSWLASLALIISLMLLLLGGFSLFQEPSAIALAVLTTSLSLLCTTLSIFFGMSKRRSAFLRRCGVSMFLLSILIFIIQLWI